MANQAQIAKQQAQQETAAVRCDHEPAVEDTGRGSGRLGRPKGASGVDVNSKSNIDVTASAAEFGQLDALTIPLNYARSSYGYETSATSATADQRWTACALQAGTAAISMLVVRC